MICSLVFFFCFLPEKLFRSWYLHHKGFSCSSSSFRSSCALLAQHQTLHLWFQQQQSHLTCLPKARFPGEVGWIICAPAWDRILVVQGRLRDLLPRSSRSCSLTSCVWCFILGLSLIQSQIWALYKKFLSVNCFEYVFGYALKIRMSNVNPWKLLDLGGWTRDKYFAYSLFKSRFKKKIIDLLGFLWECETCLFLLTSIGQEFSIIRLIHFRVL